MTQFRHYQIKFLNKSKEVPTKEEFIDAMKQTEFLKFTRGHFLDLVIEVELIISVIIGNYVWSTISARPIWGYRWMDDTNVIARFSRINASWQYVRDHVFIGIGFGRPEANYLSSIAYYVYNGFLSWWNFTGLGGMISFIAIWTFHKLYLATYLPIKDLKIHLFEYHIVCK